MEMEEDEISRKDVKPIVNGDDSSASAKQKLTADAAAKRKATLAKRRKKRRAKSRYSADSEDEKLKNRLLKKAKPKRGGGVNKANKDEDSVPLVHEIKTKSSKDKSSSIDFRRFEIVNPESYRRLVCRFEENQINKAPKPAEGGEFVESRWICALCQQSATNYSLGDLFGPYYCKIGEAFWPPYLKTKKKHSTNMYTDFWFHGYCALWTSGILAKGNVLTGLDEHLGDYWKQKCSVCQCVGASIGCVVKGCKKSFHYACAVESDCVLQEDNLTMYCDNHKKLLQKD